MFNALTPLGPPQMRHEHLQDVAAVFLFGVAPWLCLVLLAVVGILQIACPFVHVSLLLFPVAVLLVVLALVLVALLAGQFSR